MMGKTTRLLIVVAAVTLVAAAGSAQGATSIKTAMATAFVDPTTPVIFEDQDFNYLIDMDGSLSLTVGDRVFGVINIQDIFTGDGTVPPNSIKDVASSDGTGPGGIGGASAYNELTGIFGFDFVASKAVGADTYWLLGPMAGSGAGVDWATLGLVDAGGTGISYPQVGPFGSIFEIYEDSFKDGSGKSNFTSATRALAFPSATDGTYQGSIGYVRAPNFIPGDFGANVLGEFFVNADTDASIPGVEAHELNLHFLNVPAGSPFANVAPNDVSGPDPGPPFAGTPPFGQPLNFGLGATVYGEGGFEGTANPEWTKKSDADLKVLVPVPAAAWSGMLLLGVLGIVRKFRRRFV
jgi:hypothetical protein